MLVCDPFLKSAVFGTKELTVCHLGEHGLTQAQIGLPVKSVAWGRRYALHVPTVGIIVAISPDQDRVFGWDVASDHEVWSLSYPKLSLSEGLWSGILGQTPVVSVSVHGTTLQVEPVTGHILRKEDGFTRMIAGECHVMRSFESRVTATNEGIENCIIRERLREWPLPWNERVGAMIFHSEGRPRDRAKKLRCSVDFAIFGPDGAERFSLCEIAPRLQSVLAICRDDTRADFKLAYREHGVGPIKVAHLNEWENGEPQGHDTAFGMVASFLGPGYLVTENAIIALG